MTRKLILQIVVILLIAGALKFYYSRANVNDLLWLLAPTASSVEMVTEERFEFEAYSGYMNTDKTFLIAASCSGLNFLIAAFLLLAIGLVWRNRNGALKWRYLLFAAATAYLSTIVANTVRIATALRLDQVPAETGLFDDAQVHRIEGITVYFGCLLLLYFIFEATGTKKRSASIRGVVLPLGIYYTTTLFVPFANGAYQQGAVFWEHVLFVIVTPLLLVMPFALFRFATNNFFRSQFVTREALE